MTTTTRAPRATAPTRRPPATPSRVAAALAVFALAASAPTIATAGDDGDKRGEGDLDGAVAGAVLDAQKTVTVDDLIDLADDDSYDLDEDDFSDLVRFSDPGLPAAESLPATTDEKTDDGPQSAASSNEAFSLHSRPSATRKIYLDFDGHVTTGTPWNDSSNPSIVSRNYSTDRPVAPATSVSQTQLDDFSAEELDNIVDIWNRVRQDFAGWDVDVTTDDPGVAGVSRDSSADVDYGIRVVITHDSSWYGPYGGSAYLRSFDRSYDLPAFVFSSNLAGGNPSSVAEAITHEVGHTLGLKHDGIVRSDGTSSPYYSGHGSWAPIMGVGYGKAITQWSKGEYAGADNTEDDLVEIDRFVSRLADTSAGTVLVGDSRTVHTIVDGGATATHPLVITEGPVQISVAKADPTGNLLADLTIRNAAGTAVAFDAPDDETAWSLDASLPTGVTPGTYTIEVRSIGWGTPSNGFSAYASMGDYTLDIDTPGTSTTTTTTTTTVAPTTPPTTPQTTAPGSPSTTTTPPTTPTSPTTDPGSDPDASSVGHRLTAISPTRLLDTRQNGAAFSRLQAGEEIRLDVASLPGVDADAIAAVINVVAAKPERNGWLSVTPCVEPIDGQRTSSLNFAARRNIGNSVIAPLSADGAVCVYASEATDIIIDVTGWLGAAGSSNLVDVTSQRALDTRRLGSSRMISPGVRTVVSLTDLLVDDATTAVALNLTAVNPTASGFLTVDNCRSATASTSSLNFTAGRTRGNNGIFALGTNDSICVTSSVATHLTIDVNGQFAPGDGLTFIPANPQRLLDTRRDGRVAAGASAGVDIPTPSTPDGQRLAAAAVSVNIAAARHDTNSHVTAWDCGERPETSALNPVAGLPTANSALVSVASGNRACLFHSAGGDLIVDLNGWWV